jgi:hypothetical protein
MFTAGVKAIYYSVYLDIFIRKTSCQRICQQTHIISGPFLRDEVSLSFDSATALAVGVYATCTRKAPKIPQKKIYFPIDNNM